MNRFKLFPERYISILVFLAIGFLFTLTSFQWSFDRLTLYLKWMGLLDSILVCFILWNFRSEFILKLITAFSIITLLILIDLSKLSTFHLLFYRLFEISPSSLLNSVLLSFTVLISCTFFSFFLKKKRLLSLSVGIVLFLISYPFLFNSWLDESYDKSVNLSLYMDEIKVNLDEESLRNALQFTYNNIKYIAGVAPVHVNELIENGKGTCGFQTKVFQEIVRRLNIPSRYVLIHQDKWKGMHNVVEVFIHNKWVAYDPMKNQIFKKDEMHFNASHIQQSDSIAKEFGYSSKLFENILIFQNNHFIKVTEENNSDFY